MADQKNKFNPDHSKRRNTMNTLPNLQLVRTMVQEMMQEAAKDRANREERMAHPILNSRKLKLALAVAMPLVLWIVWVFVAG
jgi:hypothetical protein